MSLVSYSLSLLHTVLIAGNVAIADRDTPRFTSLLGPLSENGFQPSLVSRSQKQAKGA